MIAVFLSKVLSMLHHGSRPRINVKMSCCEEKQSQTNLLQKKFFYNGIAIFNFSTAIILSQFKELFAVEVLGFQGLPWYLINKCKRHAQKIFRYTQNHVQPQHIQNLGIFKTLAYLEPEAYAEPWHTQNRGIFRSLGYSEPEANSEPCKISTMKCCA